MQTKEQSGGQSGVGVRSKACFICSFLRYAASDNEAAAPPPRLLNTERHPPSPKP